MLYVVDSFEGGLSEDAYRGLKGAFRYGYGLDIRQTKDTLTCNQKLKKDSGTTITELILFQVSASDGNLYLFGDAGGIYKMTTSTGAYTKIATYSGTAGAGARICGAGEFTNNDPTTATLSTNLTGANNDLVFTAITPGVEANDISIEYINPGVETPLETVTVTGNAIQVTLRSVSTVLSTATQVINAINANASASILVSVANKSGNDGSGAVIAMAHTHLAGGTSTYKAYIYFATKTTLNRMLVSTNVITQDWKALSDVGTTGWHSMAEAVGTLQIANLNDLAFVDYEGGFTMSGLDFPAGDVVSTVVGQDNSVIAGTTNKLYNWDRLQVSWLNRREVPDMSIDAMIFSNYLLIHSGSTLYSWDTSALVPIRQMLRSDHSVKPGAIANYKGVPYMGVNGAADVGVYSYGTRSMIKNRTLNFEYVLSHGKTASVSIGSVQAHNNNLYVAWKDGTTYGVDIIDTANKAVARYEGLRFRTKTLEQQKFSFIQLLMEPLPTGCSIQVQYKVNGQASWITAKVANGSPTFTIANSTKAIFKIDPDPKYGGEEIEIALTLTPSGNTAPDIKAIVTTFDAVGNK